MRTSAFASSDGIRPAPVRQGAQPAFADNRPAAAAQRKLAELANNGPQAMQQKAVMDSIKDGSSNAVQRKKEEEPLQGKFETADVMGAQAVQRRIHIGKEPDAPNDYREITDSEGSTTAHYGGGPMNIAAGIYANNLANAGDEDFPDYVIGGMSDHSEKSLLDRTSASALDPEIDHIVRVADHGSNSYSNARVLSKSENNNGDADRPGDDDIVIRAHHAIRIRDNNGHDSTTAEGDALDDADEGMVDTFGGIGAVIGANSGAVSNHVRINEV